MAQKQAQEWMNKMEEWFLKLPALPKGGREAIVQITPWVALIFGILGVLAGLAGFGVLAALSPFIAMGNGFSGAAGSLVGAAFSLVASAMLLAAFPGTNKRKMQGWTLLFWSEGLSTVAAVLSFTITGVLVCLIGFYLLFQIKSYYK
ncbi:MAG: hypothetical protein KGJ07_05220 [Patescibacteria group bacterium]|nr:hypothetical protein [Patescibacteria group bacterium]MDE2590750.1 hypothetical protein [Patescibacteria group bacterium]